MLREIIGGERGEEKSRGFEPVGEDTAESSREATCEDKAVLCL
jgi:hypothetical protein